MAGQMVASWKAGLCKLLSHQWEAWALDSNDCVRSRKCQRCGEKETEQVQHSWGNWQRGPNCVDTRSCAHCGKAETRGKPKHTWGEWEYCRTGCIKTRACLHCGQREEKTATHDWGLWKIADPHKCVDNLKVRECQRCHQQETFPFSAEHTWGEWQFLTEGCTNQRVCKVCGQKEVTHHDYEFIGHGRTTESEKAGGGDDWEYYQEDLYKCKRCGEIQKQWVAHPIG